MIAYQTSNTPTAALRSGLDMRRFDPQAIACAVKLSRRWFCNITFFVL
jgi:hypothetical protein